MKIILDECLPKKLKKELTEHDVKTAPEMGWSGFSNGKLMSLLEKECDVFITMDGNLAFQQNFDKLKIAVFVLNAVKNRLQDLKPSMPKVLGTLTSPDIKGKITRIYNTANVAKN